MGNYKVPEIRLELLLNSVLKKIYDVVKTDQIQSKDLSKLLGYKHGTEVSLFKKINSMLVYGILDGRGIYSVTKLGEDLLFPESPEIAQNLKTQAIFNVELWKKIFGKNGKQPPKDGLWVLLRNITDIDPATAKKLENRVYNWYVEDMSIISDDVQIDTNTDQKDSSTTLRSSSTQDKQMSQQMSDPKLNDSLDVEVLSFDKYQIALPKGDLKKEWEKLKKYMDIKLEDYEYKESQVENTAGENNSEVGDSTESGFEE